MEQLSHRFQSWIDEPTSPHVHGEGLFFLWLSVVAWPVTRQSAGDQMDLRRPLAAAALAGKALHMARRRGRGCGSLFPDPFGPCGRDWHADRGLRPQGRRRELAPLIERPSEQQ